MTKKIKDFCRVFYMGKNKTLFWRATASIVCVYFLLMGRHVNAEGNLIINPSFEDTEDQSGWRAENWARNEVECISDPVNPHTGKFSKKMTLRRALHNPIYQLVSPGIPIKRGQGYQLRFWMRGLPNTRAIQIQIRKCGAPYTTYFSGEVALSEEWQEHVLNFTLPPNTDDKDTGLFFILWEENTFWIDDVSLTRLPEKELSEPLVGNQAPNGSFEVGRDHWFATFREGAIRSTADVPRAEENNVGVNIESRPTPDAPGGQRALTFTVKPLCGVGLTSAYFPLRYGHSVAIGFWLKTTAPKAAFNVNLGHGKFPNQIMVGEGFTAIDANWNYYSFKVTPTPSTSGTYFLAFSSTAPGEYWLDQVCAIDSADAGKDYVAAEWDFGWEALDGTPSGNLYYPNDKISFDLAAATSTGADKAAVKLRLLDFRDRELKKWTATIPLEKGRAGSVKVELPSTKQGGFKVEVRLLSDTDDAIPRAELMYSVVPRLKPLKEASADSFFGGHVRLTPYNLAVAERIGFRWIRLHPPIVTKWYNIEPTKGVFEFETRGIARAHGMGFHILGLLDTTPPFYGDCAPEDQAKYKNSGYLVPKDWDAWERYVQKTVETFKPYIQNWEIWNEPDGAFLNVRPGVEKEKAYVEILRHTRKAIDENGFSVTLIGNSVGSIDRAFTKKQLDLGGGKEVDELSFHFYNEDRGAEEKQPPLEAQLSQMQSYMNRSGKKPSIWLTESGMWLSTSGHWLKSARIPVSTMTTIPDAVNSLIRTIVGLKAMGLVHYFHYGDSAAASGSIIYRDECGGTIEMNGIPHPAGAAHAAAVFFLEEAKPIAFEQHTIGEKKATLAKFQREAETISVIWSRSGVKLGEIQGLNFEKSSGFDVMGNPMELTKETPVTLDPIYIVKSK